MQKVCQAVCGQTTSELRIRIGDHRAWMEKKKEEKEDPGRFERNDEGASADHLKQCCRT